MMAAVIKIVARADGEPTDAAGKYLVLFDHEARTGRGGDLGCSDTADTAQRFADKSAAFDFWQRQSRLRPKRPDGKDNRPLTAYTVEIEEVE